MQKVINRNPPIADEGQVSIAQRMQLSSDSWLFEATHDCKTMTTQAVTIDDDEDLVDGGVGDFQLKNKQLNKALSWVNCFPVVWKGS